jgi:hypothetical protein
MPHPDPDTLDIGELRRRDLADRRKRRAIDGDDSDFAFIPPDVVMKPDILGSALAGAVFVFAIIGAFVTIRFMLGLFF